jgi:hypothetical protein
MPKFVALVAFVHPLALSFSGAVSDTLWWLSYTTLLLGSQ